MPGSSGGRSPETDAAGKKSAKRARQKAKKLEMKAAAVAMQELAVKESQVVQEKEDSGWSKVREATFDAASTSSSVGTSVISVNDDGEEADGDEDEEQRIIDAAIARRMAVDPEWDQQEANVSTQMDKYKYSCRGECEQNLPASKILLMNHGEDWQGDVITYCQACVEWKGSDKAFSKLVKSRWTSRAKTLFDKEKNLRALKYDRIEAYYAEKLPGVRYADRRELIVAHLKVVAYSIGRDILAREKTVS